jgi:DNA polymerase-3 subunit delta
VQDVLEAVRTARGRELGTPLDLHRLSEEDLKGDPLRLRDLLTARPLLGGASAVLFRAPGESGPTQLFEALEEIERGTLAPEGVLLVEAGALTKKSRLRTVFETGKRIVCVQLYDPDAGDLRGAMQAAITGLGGSIEAEALDLLMEGAALDLGLARAEGEKFGLYGATLGRPITVDDVLALSSGARSYTADQAASLALTGDARRALAALDKALAAGSAPVQFARSVERRLRRLHDARGVMAARGLSARDAVSALRPPPSIPEARELEGLLTGWSAALIEAGLEAARRAEISMKRKNSPDDALAGRLIAAIAGLAGMGRR